MNNVLDFVKDLLKVTSSNIWNQRSRIYTLECKSCLVIRVATGQGKVRDILGLGKVKEFGKKSVKFRILKKVREICHWSRKF